ncbi:MAG: FHA domain-containing protein [Acutalibacteraceae bacterium]
MEKYKVCPVCGVHNDPSALECSDCETDLQNVPVVDESMEQAAQNGGQSTDAAPISAPMVRVCDCGAKNPVQSRRCSACGEDISMIIPSLETAPTSDNTPAVQQYLLSSLDGTFAYEIKEGSNIIGRENEMKEYLSSKPYVSRKHAELTLDTTASTLTIKNCNNTNYTFVNNNMISGDMSVELKDGDEVGLGGNEQNGSRQMEAAYFLVRIGVCM